MKQISKEISLKVSLLSLVAAIFVISIHVPSTMNMGFSYFVEDFIGTQVASAAVPFFFVISAFLLGCHIYDWGTYALEIKKRVRTLLIPYLIWCVVFTLQKNLDSFIANFACNYPLDRHIDLNPVHVFGFDLRRNPPLPLWFIRALIIYVLSFPIFSIVARNRVVMIMAVLGLCTFECTKRFLVPTSLNTLFCFTLAPRNVLAFLVGVWLSIHPVHLRRSVAGAVLFLGLGIFFMLSLSPFIPIYIPSALRTAFCLFATGALLSGTWSLCPSIELPNILKGQAFAIYLLHALFIPYVLLLARKFVFLTLWYGFIGDVVVVFVCSVTLSCMLRRYMPRFSKVVFGGR